MILANGMITGSVFQFQPTHTFSFCLLMEICTCCCQIATTGTSSRTFTAPKADDGTEVKAGVEAKGETEGEGGPEGDVETTTTISEAERSPAVTHKPLGGLQEGATK